MTYYKYYIVFIFVMFSFFANGQRQYQGTYAGTFMNGRVACMLKVSSGIIVGSMYDGPENYHSITATIEDDRFNGTIYHKAFGEGILEGFFKQDSLMLTVNFLNNFFPFMLKKQSDNLKLNIDKIFGKPHLDKNLIGDWVEIGMTHLDGNKMAVEDIYKNIRYLANGDYVFKSTPQKAGIESRWYVVGSELYTHIGNVFFSSDFSHGVYQIKSDTLVITESNRFKTITTYLRKK